MRTHPPFLASIRSAVSAAALVAATSASAQPAPAPATAAPSAAEAAAPTAQPVLRAVILHVPPIVADSDEPVELTAVIDAPFAEELGVRWRPIGETAWRDAPLERDTKGRWSARLPAAAPPGLEYYLRGKDLRGDELLHFASPQAPHRVRVDPSLVDRLQALDERRLRGRSDEVSLEVTGHNFGNRYGLPDRFTRAEAVFTHRLWRSLYHLGFGFGTLWGKTPLASTPQSHDQYLVRGVRYGFGEARLRLHPSAFLDLRVGMGVSQDGFTPMARGAVTLGKPWRASLSAGGELTGDNGHTGWVRLQWDTVPPLLMGASVVRTNLPGVRISNAGLYVAYDLAYRIVDRVTVRGQVSYGARDGSSSFGGGLATAVDF